MGSTLGVSSNVNFAAMCTCGNQCVGLVKTFIRTHTTVGFPFKALLSISHGLLDLEPNT